MANVAPVIALVGKDRFLRGEALSALMEKVADQLDSMSPDFVDGAAAALADVLDEVRTPSLLGGMRMVVVDDQDLRLERRPAGG